MTEDTEIQKILSMSDEEVEFYQFGDSTIETIDRDGNYCCEKSEPKQLDLTEEEKKYILHGLRLIIKEKQGVIAMIIATHEGKNEAPNKRKRQIHKEIVGIKELREKFS